MSTTKSLSYPTMAASEAADKSVAAAAAASTTASTGFDLINHAIRMGAAAAPLAPAPVEAAPVASDANALQTSSELLLKAHLLDRAAAAGAGTLSRVSSTSSTVGPILSHHELAASQPAAYANLVRQQLAGGSASIVAALQRRQHQPPALSELPAGLSLQLASYLNAAAAAAPGTKAVVPPSTSPTPPTTKESRQSQDEQNARQLNPNAFQFPWKLHDMLDRSSTEGYDDVVSWVDNGEAFRVHLPDVFVESVMPRFFKQTKYKSVSRNELAKDIRSVIHSRASGS